MKELEEAKIKVLDAVATWHKSVTGEDSRVDCVRALSAISTSIDSLVSLAKQEQAEVDAKILDRMTPEIPEDDNPAYVARATGIRHGLQMAVKQLRNQAQAGFKESGGWLPIESCPKGDDYILVRLANRLVEQGDSPVALVRHISEVWFESDGGVEYDLSQLTHYMPLPESPKAGQSSPVKESGDA